MTAVPSIYKEVHAQTHRTFYLHITVEFFKIEVVEVWPFCGRRVSLFSKVRLRQLAFKFGLDELDVPIIRRKKKIGRKPIPFFAHAHVCLVL